MFTLYAVDKPMRLEMECLSCDGGLVEKNGAPIMCEHCGGTGIRLTANGWNLRDFVHAHILDDWVPEKLPRLVKTCPRCEGWGLISHPAWIYWHERNKDKNPEERDSFPDVPEKVPCPECHGQGKILTKIGKQVAEVVEIVLAIRGLR